MTANSSSFRAIVPTLILCAASVAFAQIKVVSSGSSSSGRKGSFSSGGRVIQPGQPIMLFGTKGKPEEKRGFAYVVLMQIEPDNGANLNHSENASLSSTGNRVTLRDTFTINGKGAALSLDLELNPKTHKTTKETLRLNGRTWDPNKGRLFLVDARAGKPFVTQVKTTLPSDLPDPKETEMLTAMAKDFIAQVRKQDPACREFLERQ